MHDDHARDSDDPPPPMGSNANAVDRVDHAVVKARAAMVSATEAQQVAAEALATTKAIDAKLGNSPDPSMGVPGKGLFGVVSGIVVDLHNVGSKVDGLTAALESQRVAAELAATARKGSTARLVGWIASPAFAILVGAAIAYLAGFHR
jgi:hypothetical protein